MHKAREFRVPPVIQFGAGASTLVGAEASRLGAKNALIVTDGFMQKQGLVQPIADSLREAGIGVHVYAGVNSEPGLEHVQQGLEQLKTHQCDVVVTFGGGSPLDAGKAVAVMAANPGGIEEYMGPNKVRRPGLPIIAIPTTAGTGSEATQFTIITDNGRDVKMLIASPYVLPNVALVDPDLTLAMPQGLTAATGLDALTHAIEAYVSRKAQPMSDAMALSAIRLLGAHLLTAWQEPGNYEARSNTMLGALQAGIAFSNASVALVHGMSRPVGALFHVAHGVSNACLLGLVMDFSLDGNLERYAQVASCLGVNAQGLGTRALAQAGAERVKELIRLMQVPNLTALGVSREKLEPVVAKMADDALASGSPGNNPRLASKEEIIELYYSAL